MFVRVSSTLLKHAALSRCLQVMFVRVSSTLLKHAALSRCLQVMFVRVSSTLLKHAALSRCLQVMFVRVSSTLLTQRVPMAVKALKYSQWMADVAAAAAGLQHNLTARVSGEGVYKLFTVHAVAVVTG
jgi:hypothetical protein